MPPSLSMVFLNSPPRQQTTVPVQTTKQSPFFRNNMIDRLANARKGCSACGKG
jgi:hypothetical protein